MGEVLRSYRTWLHRGIAVVVIALLLALAFAPSVISKIVDTGDVIIVDDAFY